MLARAAPIGLILIAMAGKKVIGIDDFVETIRSFESGLITRDSVLDLCGSVQISDASLAPYLSHLPQRWLFPLAYMLTDESFAVTIGRFEGPEGKSPHRHWFMLGANLFMYANWQVCTVIGVVAGSLLEDANLGLDFAMSVTFIGIVVPLLRTRPLFLSAAVSGAAALALNEMPNKLGLTISTVLS